MNKKPEKSEEWENRYKEGTTGWDIGHASPPIRAYADQLEDKSLKILIPGCGNAYEAEYLHEQGFGNIFLIDLAPTPLENFQSRVPDFPEDHLIQGDFFEHEGQYDLLLEQTFFCAIHPGFRKQYAQKAASLLKKDGRLAGLLFDDPLNSDHPPYGGDKEEYLRYFRPFFEIRHFETAYNSIAPRQGRELFIELVKK